MKSSNYKDYGIRWYLPEKIDSLEKDNKRLRVINHQLKVKSDFEEAFLVP